MIQIITLVKGALASINAFNYSENPDSQSSDLVRQQLQYMLDEMAIEFLNYRKYDETVTAKNPIILGTDLTDPFAPIVGDIATKPAELSDVVLTVGSIQYPMILKTYDEYRKIPVINVNAIPATCYLKYDPQYITAYFFPGFGVTGTLRFLGKPYLINDAVSIYDYVDLPREFVGGVISNLALRICPFFGISSTPDLVIRASKDLKHIKQMEIVREMKRIRNDLAPTGQGFNFYSGGF